MLSTAVEWLTEQKSILKRTHKTKAEKTTVVAFKSKSENTHWSTTLLLECLYSLSFQGRARILLEVWCHRPLATVKGCVSRSPLLITGPTKALSPAVWYVEGQGSISMGTTVRITSSFPRRTTMLKLPSFLMTALTSLADEILWPFIEMMTSCSLSPPLQENRRRKLSKDYIWITTKCHFYSQGLILVEWNVATKAIHRTWSWL